MIPSTAGWEPMSSLSQVGSTALQTSPNHGPDGIEGCARPKNAQVHSFNVGQARTGPAGEEHQSRPKS